jgi:putative transposase
MSIVSGNPIGNFYGGLKLTKKVKLQDPSIGIRRVKNMIKLLKIKGKQDKRFIVVTTDSNHNSTVKRDLYYILI